MVSDTVMGLLARSHLTVTHLYFVTQISEMQAYNTDMKILLKYQRKRNSKLGLLLFQKN